MQKDKKQKSFKIHLATLQLRAVGTTQARAANTISCTKVDIFPGENVESSELGKRRCSYKLRITYYRKSDNWRGSFNQFLGQQECIFLGKKNTFYENTFKWQLLALFTLSKFLCDHFWTTLAASYIKGIDGNLQGHLGYIEFFDFFSRLMFFFFFQAKIF